MQAGERAFQKSPVPHISPRLQGTPRGSAFHRPACYPFYAKLTSRVGEKRLSSSWMGRSSQTVQQWPPLSWTSLETGEASSAHSAGNHQNLLCFDKVIATLQSNDLERRMRTIKQRLTRPFFLEGFAGSNRRERSQLWGFCY